MTTPDELLAACRAAPADTNTRLVLADALRDDDGGEDTPATHAVLRMGCERCDCPDTKEMMVWDAEGNWHWYADTLGYSSESWDAFFGERVDRGDGLDHAPGTLTLYRFTRWHLVCPHCKRRLVAAKAHATRKANKVAASNAAPNLFSGMT